jgi:hypothetical protein
LKATVSNEPTSVGAPLTKGIPMGDKSPKAMNKKADQKNTKEKNSSNAKSAAITAKQVAGKKK